MLEIKFQYLKKKVHTYSMENKSAEAFWLIFLSLCLSVHQALTSRSIPVK